MSSYSIRSTRYFASSINYLNIPFSPLSPRRRSASLRSQDSDLFWFIVPARLLLGRRLLLFRSTDAGEIGVTSPVTTIDFNESKRKWSVLFGNSDVDDYNNDDGIVGKCLFFQKMESVPSKLLNFCFVSDQTIFGLLFQTFSHSLSLSLFAFHASCLSPWSDPRSVVFWTQNQRSSKNDSKFFNQPKPK